jgi:hypothetical protein
MVDSFDGMHLRSVLERFDQEEKLTHPLWSPFRLAGFPQPVEFGERLPVPGPTG